MKVGVYVCRCGGIVSDKIDFDEVARRVHDCDCVAYVKSVDLGCDESGKAFLVQDLRENQPDRVVIVACSPREHEGTFRGILAEAGINPFLMQMVNAREQVVWVTNDAHEATEKTIRYVRAAAARVVHQEPLETPEVDVCTDTLVIGGGPAGLKAALTLAEAGRRVILVEKGPILGGMPVRYDEIFPRMECGPCVLEPFMAEVLHGPHAGNIEILLQSEVVGAAGSFGDFRVKIRKDPRYVDLRTCIGCAECIGVCPSSAKNPVNCGMDERKAIDFVFFGGLPNAPYLDPVACRRSGGEECTSCREACPVEGAIRYDDREEILERQVGAVLLATGGGLYDTANMPELGHGSLPSVVTSLEFERLLATNGPTGGAIQRADGGVPTRFAVVHCAGSLDARHREYCSGVCCLDAFKFNVLISHKLPDARVTHYYKTFAVAGKEEYELFGRVKAGKQTEFVAYQDLRDLSIQAFDDGCATIRTEDGCRTFDQVILMTALVPGSDTKPLAQVFDVGLDRQGYFEELHGRVDATRSKVRGIYLAGTCQGPMDLGRAMTQGASAAGAILAALVPGRKLTLEAIHAEVDQDRCSACKCCLSICPYKAISFDAERDATEVDPILCVGCGTCVAACPSGAIRGKHFTNDQIFAEIEGALA
jgi:heterodisulfide reductase subunit A